MRRALAAVTIITLLALSGCAVPHEGGEPHRPDASPHAVVSLPSLVDVPTAAPEPAQPAPPAPAAEHTIGTSVPLRDIDCAKTKCIALTFDDGPGKDTARLLGILKKHDVKVTFFFLGAWARLHPADVKRASADGHVIGTHSWNHPSFKKISDAEILDQIHRSTKYLQELSGQKVDLLRPPYGDMRKPFVKTGDAIIMWNTNTQDYLHWQVPRPDLTVQAALSQAAPNAILLIHDSHGPSVDAVEPIVTSLHKRGFVFVTIPELLRDKLKPDVVYNHG